MQQHEVQGLIALLALAACAPAPSPPPVRAATTWSLVGRLTPAGEGDRPFTGGRDLLERCGRARPCAAELWRDEVGQELRLVRAGAEYHFADGPEVWPARWRRLNGALATCLGDPLADPIAEDPGAMRLLRGAPEGAWRWELRLSGQNPCGLQGAMWLDATGQEADTHALTCHGLGWSDGGREAAATEISIERRATAEARWPELNPRQRARLIAELSRDPEAAALIERLQRTPDN